MMIAFRHFFGGPKRGFARGVPLTLSLTQGMVDHTRPHSSSEWARGLTLGAPDTQKLSEWIPDDLGFVDTTNFFVDDDDPFGTKGGHSEALLASLALPTEPPANWSFSSFPVVSSASSLASFGGPTVAATTTKATTSASIYQQHASAPPVQAHPPYAIQPPTSQLPTQSPFPSPFFAMAGLSQPPSQQPSPFSLYPNMTAPQGGFSALPPPTQSQQLIARQQAGGAQQQQSFPSFGQNLANNMSVGNHHTTTTTTTAAATGLPLPRLMAPQITTVVADSETQKRAVLRIQEMQKQTAHATTKARNPNQPDSPAVRKRRMQPEEEFGDDDGSSSAGQQLPTTPSRSGLGMSPDGADSVLIKRSRNKIAAEKYRIKKRHEQEGVQSLMSALQQQIAVQQARINELEGEVAYWRKAVQGDTAQGSGK